MKCYMLRSILLKMGLWFFLIKVTECEEEETQSCASGNSAVKNQRSKGEFETTVPLKAPEKLVISKPSNAYEFGQMINAVNANKDITACAELLKVIDPEELPTLLSNKLEADNFQLFIQALQSDAFCQDPGLVYQYLFYLSKAERFKVSNYFFSCLSENEPVKS